MAYTKYAEDDREAVSERLWERDHMTCGESPTLVWQRMQCFGSDAISKRR